MAQVLIFIALAGAFGIGVLVSVVTILKYDP
jgi:uncharacterized membrane protein YqgA involved in biofilm formation